VTEDASDEADLTPDEAAEAAAASILGDFGSEEPAPEAEAVEPPVEAKDADAPSAAEAEDGSGDQSDDSSVTEEKPASA
jgi:hypothetical protein